MLFLTNALAISLLTLTSHASRRVTQLRLLFSVSQMIPALPMLTLSPLLILLDLSIAFDTVNHLILLSTLSGLDVSGSAHSWIASYLAGRSYQVTWRGSVSAPRALTTGVPQGMFLGPQLN